MIHAKICTTAFLGSNRDAIHNPNTVRKRKNKTQKKYWTLCGVRFIFFSFITVPYQTRVMGNEIYGKIGIATALMMYFQLFLD